MAKCGCGTGTCSCMFTGSNGITTTGSGSESAPVVIAFAPGTGSSAGCERIMDCVGGNVADGLVYNDSANEISMRLSGDAGNVARVGSDGGLMVTGAGATQAPGYAWGTTNDLRVTQELNDMILTPHIDGATPGDFSVSGNSVIVHRPGVWFFQAQFRFEADLDYDANPPSGLIYGRISGTGRGRIQGATVSRDSTVYGFSYTVMMPMPTAGTSVEFYVQRSSLGWTASPTANCWWSAFRLGPTVLRTAQADPPLVVPCELPTEWMGPLTLPEPTVMQALAIDSTNGYMYTSQVESPTTSPETTRLSQLRMDGTVVGSMLITGTGHPSQIGVDATPGDTDPWIYLPALNATRIGRLKFRAGTTIASDQLELFNPFAPGSSTALSVNVDPVHRLMSVGSSIGGASRRFTLFNLDEAAAGLWLPRSAIDVPMGDAYLQTVYQGMATYGPHLYVQTGWGYNDSGGVNQAYTAVYDWSTGQRLHLCLNEWRTDLEYREPEGLAVWVLDPARPDEIRLVQGFADGPVGTRVLYLNYWNAVGQPDD